MAPARSRLARIFHWNPKMAESRPTAEAILSRAWQRRGLLACLLWPLSLLFGALAALRRGSLRWASSAPSGCRCR
jgi:hypothetical protein